MKRVFLFFIYVAFAFAQYPKIGNYYLNYDFNESVLDSLAMCDLVVLDHEVGHSRKEMLDSLRARNPHIKIYPYIVTQEINDDALLWSGSLRKSLYEGIQEHWWLKNSNGENVVFWPGTKMLNIGAGTPEKSSIEWNRYFATFVCDSILATGLWDGLYLDNCWHSVRWLDGNIDVDRDGQPDRPATADSLWEVGMQVLLDIIRDSYPSISIIGNGGYRYGDKINGALFETFPVWGEWFRLMDSYWRLDSSAVASQVNFINSNTENSGEISFQNMRFGLTSALLGDGYYSYNYGADNHSQNWWFDEYSFDLGAPLSGPQKKGEHIFLQENFETGGECVSLGDWEMSATLVDTLDFTTGVKADVSGEVEWNEIITSKDTLKCDSVHVRGEIRLRVLESTDSTELFAILRKGSEYDKDINLLSSLSIREGLDTTILLYSDSLIKESGYRLIIGCRFGGHFLFDDLFLETDKDLIYTREFVNGMVVCNPSQRPQHLSLAGQYEKLKGVQDPVHNDGASITELILEARDGIILKKSVATIPNKKNYLSKPVSVTYRKGVLHVNGGHPDNENTELSIYTLQGKRLVQLPLSSRSVILEGFASGTYVTIVSTKSRELVRGKLLIP